MAEVERAQKMNRKHANPTPTHATLVFSLPRSVFAFTCGISCTSRFAWLGDLLNNQVEILMTPPVGNLFVLFSTWSCEYAPMVIFRIKNAYDILTGYQMRIFPWLVHLSVWSKWNVWPDCIARSYHYGNIKWSPTVSNDVRMKMSEGALVRI